MTHKNVLVSFCLILLSACMAKTDAPTHKAPHSLTVAEGFASPFGFYNPTPSFSWILPAEVKSQSAYQIQVFSGQQANAAAILWDSEKVTSGESIFVGYQGEALSSRKQVAWRVKLWDEQDQASQWSTLNHIEMGLLANTDWSAQWIGLPKSAYTHKSRYDLTQFQPTYLRKTFNIPQKIKKARLYIAALGVYEVQINGKKVGNDFMPPGWVPYEDKVETLTYDVTEHLNNSNNAFGIILGAGWHSSRMGFSDHYWVERPAPKVIAQLEYELEDGSIQTLVTDQTWVASNAGPITKSSVYDGEDYKQDERFNNWSQVSFDATPWQTVTSTSVGDKPALQPKRHNTVKEITRLLPIAINRIDADTAVFDLGQNMVGIPHIKLPIKQGQKLTVRFAEMLKPNGEVYTDNYRSALSTNTYTASTDHLTDWQPKFTFHGFRYVEISGFSGDATPDQSWLEGVVLHSDFDNNGTFSSSNTKLNQLQKNIVWGLKGNFLEIPTDCPQRDERLGWSGDAQVFAPTSLFNASVHSFWASWLESMQLTQDSDGGINVFLPDVPNTRRLVSPGWLDAATIIPWEIYFRTGDKKILSENYQMMKDTLKFYKGVSKQNIVLIEGFSGFGDWLQPNLRNEKQDKRGDTAIPLIGTAFYAHSTALTARTARLLGKNKEAEELETLFKDIKAAYINRFFDDQANIKEGFTTQTAYLLSLKYNLLTDQLKPLAQAKLLDLITQDDNHLRTGFLGTPLLASVLDEMGQSDLMYRILFKETYPSWFYSINQGATTIWERWNSFSHKDGFNPGGMNSFNHYAYGAIGQWMYERIGGVSPIKAGYKEIRFAPLFHGPLDSAKVSYNSPYGVINSAWEKHKKHIEYTITIPSNTLGQIEIPAQQGQIKVNGKDLTGAQGISDISQKQTHLHFKAAPGTYIITFSSI